MDRNKCEKVSCERINIGKVLRSKTQKISDKTKKDFDASNFNKVVDDNNNSALKKAVLRRSCVALKTPKNIFGHNESDYVLKARYFQNFFLSFMNQEPNEGPYRQNKRPSIKQSSQCKRIPAAVRIF